MMDGADLLSDLHEFSGLTWEELARLFDVSKNAMANWVSGGMMNAGHAQFLVELSEKIRSLPAVTAGERRSLLFAPRGRRLSMFDEILYEQMNKRGPAIRD